MFMIIRELAWENLMEASNLYCNCFQKEKKEIFEKDVSCISDMLPHHLFGLFLQEELIGMVQIDFLYLHFENQKIAYINSFCIKEDYQNRGFGDKLLKWCIQYAKDNQADKINMTSNKQRIYAHMLYQKNGFSPVDTVIFKKELEKESTLL